MRLVDLNPQFYGYGGEGISDKYGNPSHERTGIGLLCDCPCGKCGNLLGVPFANPIDGQPPPGSLGPRGWERTGETFDTLTLSPSILRNRAKGGCGWHGFIRNGEVICA